MSMKLVDISCSVFGLDEEKATFLMTPKIIVASDAQ